MLYKHIDTYVICIYDYLRNILKNIYTAPFRKHFNVFQHKDSWIVSGPPVVRAAQQTEVGEDSWNVRNLTSNLIWNLLVFTTRAADTTTTTTTTTTSSDWKGIHSLWNSNPTPHKNIWLYFVFLPWLSLDHCFTSKEVDEWYDLWCMLLLF